MNQKTLTWILFIFLSLTWGSSFILIKKSMFPVSNEQAVLNPYQVGALRVLIAGIALFPLSIRHLKKLKGKPVLFFTIAGVCGNLIPSMLFPLAQTNISSSLAGLLNSTTSFFVVLIGMIVFKARPTRY